MTIRLLLLSLLLAMFTECVQAAARRPLADVSIEAITKDTQVQPQGAGDRHMSLAWWIPHEFWEAVLARDTNTPEQGKQALLEALAGVSILAVVQADISPLGAFNFYSEKDVAKNLQVSVTDAAGKKQALSPMQKISSDLEVTLGVIKPILTAAMGNLGNSFHFYVLNDKSPAGRLLDPYQKSRLNLQLKSSGGIPLPATIELPLNSLYVPRKCPNGLDAHVSWRFCPWNGERLED